MPTVQEQTDTYATTFLEIESTLTQRDPDWLTPVRKGAIARFGELGFPTVRDEEWRYTNVSRIAKAPFTFSAGPDTPVSLKDIAPFLIGGSDGHRLVFVNGRFAPGLSNAGEIDGGVTAASLGGVLGGDAESLQPHLTRHADHHEQPFVAMNTAFMVDGAYVRVRAGHSVESPIQLLFVSTATDPPFVTHPRNLIVVEAGASAKLVQSYVALGEGVYFNNVVDEVVVGENASLEIDKIQQESEQAYHIAWLAVHQARSSRFKSNLVNFGAALARHDANPVLDDEGCDSTLNGLYVVHGDQHVDNHLRVDHAKPHGDSREYFKGILSDRARGVFTGRIIVRQDAQKTDAKQSNMNLLLSEDARVDTKPQLEIFADDVKCTHGATIGQLDRDAIFYLRARGLSADDARGLLVQAFAGEMLDKIGVPAVRERLEAELIERLPHVGERMRESA